MPGLLNPFALAGSTPGGNAYDVAVLGDSPLFYLKLDETTGTTAADSSGSSHTGTIFGSPSLNQTKVMPSGTGSIKLDSTSKQIIVTNGSWMNATAWTAEAWIRIITVGGSYQNVFNREAFTARGWNLYVTGGKLNAFCGPSGSNSDHLGTTTLVAGTNYQVAMTSDGTTVKTYLNGSLEGSFTTAASVGDTTAGLTIGSSLAGGTFQAFSLNGYIDHVSYYGAALSAAQIAAHYAAA